MNHYGMGYEPAHGPLTGGAGGSSFASLGGRGGGTGYGAGGTTTYGSALRPDHITSGSEEWCYSKGSGGGQGAEAYSTGGRGGGIVNI